MCVYNKHIQVFLLIYFIHYDYYHYLSHIVHIFKNLIKSRFDEQSLVTTMKILHVN